MGVEGWAVGGWGGQVFCLIRVMLNCERGEF